MLWPLAGDVEAEEGLCTAGPGLGSGVSMCSLGLGILDGLVAGLGVCVPPWMGSHLLDYHDDHAPLAFSPPDSSTPTLPSAAPPQASDLTAFLACLQSFPGNGVNIRSLNPPGVDRRRTNYCSDLKAALGVGNKSLRLMNMGLL